MSHVFPRASGAIPLAVRGEGVWVTDSEGKRYLDAAGGAIVNNVGHGDAKVVRAMAEQAESLSYVHATTFTTEVLQAYADELAPLLPVNDPRIYPVSGGSEAVETALKLARTYHLARGEPERHRVIARWSSYHGNTLGALDASGRMPLREPYQPWLGRAAHVPAVYEYRCPFPSHPDGCGAAHAAELDRAIQELGPESVAAFIAEPIVGATLGAAVPPDDYWPAVAEVCRKHGVLLIADEVMTGFGRTGRWFGLNHWNVRADILVAGKGASSGYWPLGLCVASGEVFEAVREVGFVHGFTASHHAVGAAVGRAVLRRLREGHLVEESKKKGEILLSGLRESLADSTAVGDVRGLGLMVGIELVWGDRQSKEPFPRESQAVEQIVTAAKERGLLVYWSTGCADGTSGDVVMLGPPFIISIPEIARIVETLATIL